jgi:poly(A) polymerase
MGRGEHTLPALHDAIDDTFNAKIGDVSGRGKLGGDMREIWAMQIRFDKRVGSSPYSMLEQPRFRAGFDFLRLRAQTGEIEMELAEWWEKFSTAYDDERHDMIESMRLAQLQKPQQARVRVKKVDTPATDVRFSEPTDSVPNSPADANQLQGEFDQSAPARKRRRRRKPANRGAVNEGGSPPEA